LCFGFLHKSYLEDYDEYPKEIKEKVERIKKMCYEVYCAGSQELFDAYMKWMSQVVKGKKQR
jgi:hypothetical protein